MKDQDYIPNMEGLPDDLYEAAREIISRSGNRKVDNGDGTRTISHSTCWLPINIEAFVKLKMQEVAIAFAQWATLKGWRYTVFTDDERLWANDDCPDDLSTSALYAIFLNNPS